MKKFVKKMFAGLLAVILITGILPAYTQTAEAATTDSVYKIVRFRYAGWGEPARVKVYGKYYWNDFSNIYCSSTPDGEGNVIAAAPEGYMIDDHFITNGTRIYYDVKPKDYTKAETIFYYVPNSGKTNPVKIRSVSSNSWLVSYYSYNRKLYTYRYNSTTQAYQLYSLNTKTKQYTRVNSNFQVIAATGGSRYIYGISNRSEDGLKIYDAKAGKLIRKISPKASNNSSMKNRIEQAMVSGGKLYYLETGYYTTTVFETSLSGSTAPKAVLRKSNIKTYELAGGKLYYCTRSDNYYCFDLKTKVTKGISMDTYNSVSRIFT